MILDYMIPLLGIIKKTPDTGQATSRADKI